MADNEDAPKRVGPRGFPSWQDLYASAEVEGLPWYNPDLDRDLAAALDARGASSGSFLDIGTGPGTQAIQLGKRGFTVTGTDLAASAIEKAKALSSDVRWIEDDILKTQVSDSFDFIFDRGCFHTISPEDRPTYVANLKRLVKPGGTAFIKCFSVDQPGDYGPYRFSHEDIARIFSADFAIESITDTVYEGPLPEPQRSLFVVLHPKA